MAPFSLKRSHALKRGLDVFMAIKGTKANESLAALAKADAGRTYNLNLIQQHVEKLPRAHLGVNPDLRGILSAGAAIAHPA